MHNILRQRTVRQDKVVPQQRLEQLGQVVHSVTCDRQHVGVRAAHVDKLKVGRVAVADDVGQDRVAMNDGGRERALIAFVTVEASKEGVKMIVFSKSDLSIYTLFMLDKAITNLTGMVAIKQRCMRVGFERMHSMQRFESHLDMMHSHLTGRKECRQRDAVHTLDSKRDGCGGVRHERGKQEAQRGRDVAVEMQLAADGGRRGGFGDGGVREGEGVE